MSLTRYLQDPLEQDLAQKMVFVAGPRQVGKTTLAKRILQRWDKGLYLSWDRREDRSEIRAARWPAGKALLVFDELHKLRSWKRWIKGEYDKHGDRLRFLVTGSARLDVYRRGGDSLQGRYFHYRLHPLSLGEIEGGGQGKNIVPFREIEIPETTSRKTLELLFRFGGFPEPFLSQSERSLRRWQKDRMDRFIREDVRDLEPIRDFSSMQILADLIPERVGSPLSLNALREDLEVSHRAVSHWVEILERLYFHFRVRPFSPKKVRGLRKMPKVYLWDYGLVADPATRFENLVAQHLLKFCHFLEDTEGIRLELRYLRDVAGHEVDFLVTAQGKPWFAVECKLAEDDPDSSLLYFRERMEIPWAYQIALQGQRDFLKNGIRCLPAGKFLKALP